MSLVRGAVTRYHTRCAGRDARPTGSRGLGTRGAPLLETEEQTFWTFCKIREQPVCPAGQTCAGLGPTRDPGKSQQTGVDQLLSRQADTLLSIGHAVGIRAGQPGVAEPAQRAQVGSTTPLLTLQLHTLLQIKV